MSVRPQVYALADIRNALMAARQAINATADEVGDKADPFIAGFLTGYRAALSTLGLAFDKTTRSEAGVAQRRLPWTMEEAIHSSLPSEITG
ncbi:MAG: hypothetical protein OEZ24_06420 [Candidatus Bathyarchaeota archaeon]|nr:hypothetical protein [Candidatus Bathyarchaeota archaeon]